MHMTACLLLEAHWFCRHWMAPECGIQGSPPLAVFPDLLTHRARAMLLGLLRLQRAEYLARSAAVRQLVHFKGALHISDRVRSKHFRRLAKRW